MLLAASMLCSCLRSKSAFSKLMFWPRLITSSWINHWKYNVQNEFLREGVQKTGFCCSEQLNRWTCHWLTDWLLLLPYKEQSQRLATIETFDQTDFLKDFQIFKRPLDFWTILKFWKIFRFLDNARTCDIWDNDYNSDNWEPEFITIFSTDN